MLPSHLICIILRAPEFQLAPCPNPQGQGYDVWSVLYNPIQVHGHTMQARHTRSKIVKESCRGSCPTATEMGSHASQFSKLKP